MLVVTKLDRLARSVADLMVTVQTLDRKNVGLRVLNLGMDTHTPTGKLMLTVLGGVAQFEREMMLERQREGVAKAKAAGRYKGRKPVAPELRDAVLQLASLGTTKVSIARQLNLGEATVYRISPPPRLPSQAETVGRRRPYSQMALLAAMWSLPLRFESARQQSRSDATIDPRNLRLDQRACHTYQVIAGFLSNRICLRAAPGMGPWPSIPDTSPAQAAPAEQPQVRSGLSAYPSDGHICGFEKIGAVRNPVGHPARARRTATSPAPSDYPFNSDYEAECRPQRRHASTRLCYPTSAAREPRRSQTSAHRAVKHLANRILV